MKVGKQFLYLLSYKLVIIISLVSDVPKLSVCFYQTGFLFSVNSF